MRIQFRRICFCSWGREIRKIDVGKPQEPARIAITDAVAEISLGRHLVYSRTIEDTNIWRAALPKGQAGPAHAEMFISSTRMDQTPQYSPDGKKIAFMSAVWLAGAVGLQLG
jgi:hypothetical protein